jgi:hypothetical protein
LAAQQLRSSTGDGVHIQAQQLGHALIAAVAPLQTFQPGVESTLLYVQQTVEKEDGRLQGVTRALLRLARRPLLLTSLAWLGVIQVASGQFPAAEMMLLHQAPQRVFRGHVNQRVQFVGEPISNVPAVQCGAEAVGQFQAALCSLSFRLPVIRSPRHTLRSEDAEECDPCG